MLEKLEEIKRRFEDVEAKLADPTVIADMKLFKKLNIEYKELGEIVTQINIYKIVLSNIEEAKSVLTSEKDKDFLEMAKAELEEKRGKDFKYIPDFYLPDTNTFVEIKGYVTDKDKAKWKYFPHSLNILKKDELKQIGII